MVILLFALAFGVLALIVWILRFAFADADLVLLSKPAPPSGAFRNKVVWITGASQGIGKDLATKFASLEANLILSSRSVKKLEEVKKHCNALFPAVRIEVLALDFSLGSNETKRAAEVAEALFEGTGVDILVHNAAYPRPKILGHETSEEIIRGMFEVNVFGAISLTTALIPSMLVRKSGQIVVVSSAAGKVPAPTQAVYAATKHAVNGFFHTLHYELIKQGISVTVVCPGPIATSTPRTLMPPGNDPAALPTSDDVAEALPDDDEEKRNRMTSEHCASLIVSATYHKLHEAWISTQPVLLVMYIMQYLPGLGRLLFQKVGPKRVAALKQGKKDLYSTSILFGTSEPAKKKI